MFHVLLLHMKQKLPESVWREIRHEYQNSQTTCRALADKYGINPETVSSRCKIEKWRNGRQVAETRRFCGDTQLGSNAVLVPSQQDFTERVLREANQWLDRIDEAYEVELRYDRIEAIQKLLPQWKNTVEAAKKSMDGQPEPAKKSPMLDLAVLIGNYPLPPLIEPRPSLMDQQTA
jgi:hypothetical protein